MWTPKADWQPHLTVEVFCHRKCCQSRELLWGLSYGYSIMNSRRSTEDINILQCLPHSTLGGGVRGWYLSDFAEEKAKVLEDQVSHKLMYGRVNIWIHNFCVFRSFMSRGIQSSHLDFVNKSKYTGNQKNCCPNKRLRSQRSFIFAFGQKWGQVVDLKWKRKLIWFSSEGQVQTCFLTTVPLHTRPQGISMTGTATNE